MDSRLQVAPSADVRPAVLRTRREEDVEWKVKQVLWLFFVQFPTHKERERKISGSGRGDNTDYNSTEADNARKYLRNGTPAHVSLTSIDAGWVLSVRRIRGRRSDWRDLFVLAQYVDVTDMQRNCCLPHGNAARSLLNARFDVAARSLRLNVFFFFFFFEAQRWKKWNLIAL